MALQCHLLIVDNNNSWHTVLNVQWNFFSLEVILSVIHTIHVIDDLLSFNQKKFLQRYVQVIQNGASEWMIMKRLLSICHHRLNMSLYFNEEVLPVGFIQTIFKWFSVASLQTELTSNKFHQSQNWARFTEYIHRGIMHCIATVVWIELCWAYLLSHSIFCRKSVTDFIVLLSFIRSHWHTVRKIVSYVSNTTNTELRVSVQCWLTASSVFYDWRKRRMAQPKWHFKECEHIAWINNDLGKSLMNTVRETFFC